MRDEEIKERLDAAVQAHDAQDYPAALKEINEVLRYHPDNYRALFCLAQTAKSGHSFGIALLAARRLADIAPGSPSAINAYGCGLDNVGAEDEALVQFYASYKLRPLAITALHVANLMVNRCNPHEARKWFAKAKSDEGWEEIQRGVEENETYAELALRNWNRGWELMSKTQGGRNRRERAYGDAVTWSGEKAGTLVVYTDQGIGDEIMYASCLPDIQHLADKVIIDCSQRMEAVYAASFPWADVQPTRHRDHPHWINGEKPTHKTMISELPRYTRQTDDAFPGTPYLLGDPDRRLMYRALLDNVRRVNPRRLKLGLAWTGGIPNTGQQRRSLELEDLRPILNAFPNIDWFSLQYMDAPDAARYGVTHYPFIVQTKDYGDTAAFVAELDAVVSVQTAAVHLAGALGKPTFVLTSDRPVWRYGSEGSSMPWYKSVRLYRQKAGDWRAAFDPLIADLKEFTANAHLRGISQAAD